MSFSRTLLRVVVLTLVLALAACTTATIPSDTTTDPVDPVETTVPETTAPGDTTPTTIPAPVSTTVPDLSHLDVSPEIRQQLEELILETQRLRELPFLHTPNIVVLPPADFEARVREVIEESMEDMPADAALYRLLGLLDEEDDLEAMLGDLYGEQVGGFYDGEEDEIVVPSLTSQLSLVSQGTMVHELTHALVQQHFEATTIRIDMIEEERYDQATAYLALIEGDAVLTELVWITTLSPAQITQFLAEAREVDTSVLDTMPGFIQDSLLFPYDSGLAFVQTLHTRGGWEAVNDAYRTMPGLPGSTEQIITPDDFGRDLPVEVPVIDVAVPDYELVTTSVWGELGFRLMFDQVLGQQASMVASDGWGGDFYHQWFDGENAALLLVYVGDTANDLEELRDALVDYSQRAVADGAFYSVEEAGGYLYYVVAHDPAVGQHIRAEAGLD